MYPDNTIDMAEPAESGGFDFKRILNLFLPKWYWFLLSLIVCFCIAFIKLRYTESIFSTSAVIMLENKSDNSESAAIAQAISGGGGTKERINMDNEIEMLKSQILTHQVIQNLELNFRYYVSGKFHELELYKTQVPFNVKIIKSTGNAYETKYTIVFNENGKFVIAEEKKKGQGQRWKGALNESLMLPFGVMQIVPANSTKFPVGTYSFAYTNSIEGNVMMGLNVVAPMKYGTKLVLAYDDNIPERGADIINGVISEYKRMQSEEKQRASDSAIAFVNQRLTMVGTELHEIEARIDLFKKSNGLISVSSQATDLLARNSEVFEKVTNLEVQLNIIDAMERYVTDGKEQRVLPVSIVVENPAFTEQVKMYNEMVMQKEQLLLSATEENIAVKTIEKNIQERKQAISQSLASYKKSLRVRLDEFKKQDNAVGDQMKGMTAKERTFLDYSRQQSIEEELFLFLMKRREEMAITRSSSFANVQTLSPAQPNYAPLYPVRSKFYLTGLFMGILLPAAILFLIDMMNNKIRFKSDILSKTRVPILAEIGQKKGDEGGNTEMVVQSNSRNALSEQFRGLRENLNFILSGINENALLLTSSVSGEGKTFIAINLANIIALSGKKVVIVDLDLRKPKVHKYANVSNASGFTDFAIGEKQYQDVMKATSMSNVFVITSGPVPPNPSELLLLPKTEELFTLLKKEFDFIIVDTPPVGLVVDATIVSRYVDTTLFVVRQNFTQKGSIPQINTLISKLPKLNIVVNDVSNYNSFNGYTYGNGYGYNYGYGYYEEDDTKKGLFSFFKKG